MAGHQKHYIPHDDLLALIAAIESLETTVETLDDSIGTLNTTIKKTLKERFEVSISATHTTEAENGEVVMRNAVLSATKDCYIRRIKAFVETEDTNPLLLYNSDILIGIGVADGTSALLEPLFGRDQDAVYRTSIPNDRYTFYRTWFINDFKLPANTELHIDIYLCNIEIGTVLTIYIDM